MVDKVKVAYSDVPADVASRLLAAAEKLEVEPGVVETTSDGVFLVPEDVAKEADLDYESDAADDADSDEVPAEQLKGKALAAALKERGLPDEGTADEKRAAVAAYDEENS